MKPEHPEVNYGKTGVLIINLGTPDSTSWLDIRKYLREFLSDRRVIEVNPIIWQIILNLFILNFRPSKTAKAYKEIWMKDKNMSPLRFFTQIQAEKLSQQISNEKLIVDFAMRYGNPSIKSKINKLHDSSFPSSTSKTSSSFSSSLILPSSPPYVLPADNLYDSTYTTLLLSNITTILLIILISPHAYYDGYTVPCTLQLIYTHTDRKLACGRMPTAYAPTCQWKPTIPHKPTSSWAMQTHRSEDKMQPHSSQGVIKHAAFLM